MDNNSKPRLSTKDMALSCLSVTHIFLLSDSTSSPDPKHLSFYLRPYTLVGSKILLFHSIPEWVNSVTKKIFTLEAGNSKNRVPAHMVSHESTLPVCMWPCSCHVFTWWRVSLGASSSYTCKGTNPIMRLYLHGLT